MTQRPSNVSSLNVMVLKCALTTIALYCTGTAAFSAPLKINSRDGLAYVRVTSGSFDFGCSPGDRLCFAWEKPPRQVFVKEFWIGQTEVTQRAYEKVMRTNPSFYRGDDRPVDRVSWNNARAYCDAVGMRLPTEMEWEYAARGGTRAGTYSPVDKIAWYDGDSADRTHAVGGKRPNGYGLYDMLGNVWEWVQERYEIETNKRILRGGSFYNPARELRFSNRLWATPETAHRDMGVRCAGN